DSIPISLNAYNSAKPFKAMLGVLGITALLGGPFNFGFLVLLFGMGWYFAKLSFGEEKLPHWAGMLGEYYRDALWIGLGGSAGLIGLERLLEIASTLWPTMHRSLAIGLGRDFDAVVPAASIIGGTLLASFKTTGYVMLVASFVAAKVQQT